MNILARFTLDGVPATGLSPTITVYKVSDNSVVVNAQAMTEIAGGWYKYSFTGYSETEEYCFGCDGGATLSGSERYPGGATNTEGTVTVIAADVAGLDGAAMRGTDGAYTGTPPTAVEIREEMDDHSTQLMAISANLLRALGLLNENSYLDQLVYSGTHLTSGRLRTYSDPASVGTASDVLATYTITATWEDDLLKTYEVVKQ